MEPFQNFPKSFVKQKTLRNIPKRLRIQKMFTNILQRAFISLEYICNCLWSVSNTFHVEANTSTFRLVIVCFVIVFTAFLHFIWLCNICKRVSTFSMVPNRSWTSSNVSWRYSTDVQELCSFTEIFPSDFKA